MTERSGKAMVLPDIYRARRIRSLSLTTGRLFKEEMLKLSL
jgi:hypothetical protein